MRARRQTFNWLTRNFSRLSSERSEQRTPRARTVAERDIQIARLDQLRRRARAAPAARAPRSRSALHAPRAAARGARACGTAGRRSARADPWRAAGSARPRYADMAAKKPTSASTSAMPSCSQSASPMFSRSSSQRCCASPKATTWLFQNVFAASHARRNCAEQRVLPQEVCPAATRRLRQARLRARSRCVPARRRPSDRRAPSRALRATPPTTRAHPTGGSAGSRSSGCTRRPGSR